MKILTTTRILSALGFSALIVSCTPSEKKEENASRIATEANNKRFDEKDSRKEAAFVVDVVGGNYAEIKLARLAIRKSSSIGVKEIATIVDRDHTKVLHDLIAFANEKGISIPLEETPKESAQIAKLSKKEGISFDKKWYSEMVDNYESTIRKFEVMLDMTDDPELKELISEALPNLKNHLEQLVERQDQTKS